MASETGGETGSRTSRTLLPVLPVVVMPVFRLHFCLFVSSVTKHTAASFYGRRVIRASDADGAMASPLPVAVYLL